MKRFCDKCGKTNREGVIIHLNLAVIDLTGGIEDLFGGQPLDKKYRAGFQKLSSEGIDLCKDHFLEVIRPSKD